MIQNAIAHNKFLKEDELNQKYIEEILRLTHPLDREYFMKKLMS